MKLLVFVLLLMAVATRAAGQERILNLKDVTPRITNVGGKMLIMSFDGPVPQALALASARLPATQEERIEVRHGKDLVGYAWLKKDRRKAVQAKPTLALIFETADQAKAAERVLRMGEAVPAPLGTAN